MQTFKTKYKYKDNLYYLKDATIKNGKVLQVKVFKEYDRLPVVSYIIDGAGYENWISEDKLFTSIQALKKNIALSIK